eukprot:scaffold18195_cov75-Skeletonema_dohrnii-CCMP3373.AAC.1
MSRCLRNSTCLQHRQKKNNIDRTRSFSSPAAHNTKPTTPPFLLGSIPLSKSFECSHQPLNNSAFSPCTTTPTNTASSDKKIISTELDHSCRPPLTTRSRRHRHSFSDRYR